MLLYGSFFLNSDFFGIHNFLSSNICVELQQSLIIFGNCPLVPDWHVAYSCFLGEVPCQDCGSLELGVFLTWFSLLVTWLVNLDLCQFVATLISEDTPLDVLRYREQWTFFWRPELHGLVDFDNLFGRIVLEFYPQSEVRRVYLG